MKNLLLLNIVVNVYLAKELSKELPAGGIYPFGAGELLPRSCDFSRGGRFPHHNTTFLIDI
jgi:hypothetical protein